MAMIAITTNSSMSVNPRRVLDMVENFQKEIGDRTNEERERKTQGVSPAKVDADSWRAVTAKTGGARAHKRRGVAVQRRVVREPGDRDRSPCVFNRRCRHAEERIRTRSARNRSRERWQFVFEQPSAQRHFAGRRQGLPSGRRGRITSAGARARADTRRRDALRGVQSGVSSLSAIRPSRRRRTPNGRRPVLRRTARSVRPARSTADNAAHDREAATAREIRSKTDGGHWLIQGMSQIIAARGRRRLGQTHREPAGEQQGCAAVAENGRKSARGDHVGNTEDRNSPMMTLPCCVPFRKSFLQRPEESLWRAQVDRNATRTPGCSEAAGMLAPLHVDVSRQSSELSTNNLPGRAVMA
jgi:hypothetical protein